MLLKDILEQELTTEERIQKAKDFWDRKPGSLPLIGRENPIEWGYQPWPLKGGEFAVDQISATPDMVDVNLLLDKARGDENPFHDGDIFGQIPTYRNAWSEAIVGSEVSIGANSVLGRMHPDFTPDQRLYEFSVEKVLNGPWFQKYKEYIDAEIAQNPKYPLRQPHIRGILDMLAAYLGETELCYAIYDDPDELKALGEKFVQVHEEIIKYELLKRPLWNGGRGSYWRIYVPGDCVDYQLDASNIFSPDDYKEFFLPFDKAVIDKYPFSVVHIHMLTGGIHIPSLLTIDNLKTIELHIDRECGLYNFEALSEYVNMIHDAGKRVIIYGALLEEEVQRCIDEFRHEGLCIMFWQPEAEWLEAEKIAQGK